MLTTYFHGGTVTMQTAFGSAFGSFDRYSIEQAERRLLEALRVAVAEISIKELSYRLDLTPSLLADALAERSHKGVRASWLITIIEMASLPLATEIAYALLARKQLEATECKQLTA